LKYHLALIYHDRDRIDEARHLLLSCGDQPKFAPFYATRAALFNDSSADFVLADLKKAFQLDSSSRYRKLLVEFYANRKNYDAALLLMQPYIQQHRDDYVMGILYARILLLNKQYAAADNLLTHLTIIPFEGATLSHELYRQAKLMESVAAYKNKNYKQSISFIEQARRWPENLGVGKPYDADIDKRLEYWLAYLNYKAINKTGDANKMLDSVIINSDEVAVTDKYFTNTIITQLAFKQLDKSVEGENWLQHEGKSYPDKDIATWIASPDLNSLPALLNDKERLNAEIITSIEENTSNQ
jgi:hypothetical protein